MADFLIGFFLCFAAVLYTFCFIFDFGRITEATYRIHLKTHQKIFAFYSRKYEKRIILEQLCKYAGLNNISVSGFYEKKSKGRFFKTFYLDKDEYNLLGNRWIKEYEKMTGNKVECLNENTFVTGVPEYDNDTAILF